MLPNYYNDCNYIQVYKECKVNCLEGYIKKGGNLNCFPEGFKTSAECKSKSILLFL